MTAVGSFRIAIVTAIATALCVAAGLTLPGRPAHAGSHDLRPAQALPAYQKECGDCHLAYPPALLPAPSWRRITDRLQRHYGTDASVNDSVRREIGDWLAAHAGTYKRVGEEPDQDRISRSAWFTRKHRRITADTWRRPAIGSASNCAACHPHADRGDFEDDDARIPR